MLNRTLCLYSIYCGLILFIYTLLTRFKKAYFKDYYNYLQIVSVVLPLLIIPFRAATTWCASTGGGYCTLPVNSTAMGNTSISESCIVASSVQWIVASLAYLVNALLIVEFVALFRYAHICGQVITNPHRLIYVLCLLL